MLLLGPRNVFAMSTAMSGIMLFDMLTEKYANASAGIKNLRGRSFSAADLSAFMFMSI
jgi:hypothetical protein